MLLSLPRSVTMLAISILPLALTAKAQTAPAQTAQQPAATTQPAQPPDPDAQIDKQAEAEVIASLQARNFDAALTGAKAILDVNPASPKADKLVGVVLLDQQKASDALPYFEKALQLAPDDPTIHGLLLQAYAQSGDKADRDQQRAILRGFHTDGKHPGFAQIPSYLIETIPLDGKVIQANEFYEPSGEFHFYYRFNIFDSAGNIQSFIALESDDADQASFAKQHPKQAAAGERRFSLDGYSKSPDGNVTQALYTFYDGQPTYDDVRALVLKLVQTGKAPVPPTPAKAAK
ncbi:MAG TPA: tetratricopeptide repeat protein [Silvibacterium sp.]|nr:tetratricopeptide repeat protein [Silvibacterium sp.]